MPEEVNVGERTRVSLSLYGVASLVSVTAAIIGSYFATQATLAQHRNILDANRATLERIDLKLEAINSRQRHNQYIIDAHTKAINSLLRRAGIAELAVPSAIDGPK